MSDLVQNGLELTEASPSNKFREGPQFLRLLLELANAVMIRSVEITNFKNIRHQRIELEPLTVFVGANASGKTSVLEAIDLAGRSVLPAGLFFDDDTSSRFSGSHHCDWLYSRGSTGDLVIKCATDAGDLSVSARPPEEFPPSQVSQYGSHKWTFAVSPSENEALERALKATSNTFLCLDSANLVAPSYSEQNPPLMESDGRGLASVLAYLALSSPDEFELLTDEMRRLVPHLKRIRFSKERVRQKEREIVRFGNQSVEREFDRDFQGDAILFDFNNATNIAAHAASEGTLILLGLLTVLLSPRRPDILLLDDIDRGLHPLAQTSLLQILAKIMDRFPKLQILATAHSPYLVDALQPEQLRLMTLDANGDAICGRLTDHPEFEKWKDEMAPGEMWSLFGEKWLAEGGAAK